MKLPIAFLLIIISNNVLIAKSYSLRDIVAIAYASSFDLKKSEMMNELYIQLKKEYLREYLPKLSIGLSKEESRVIRGPDEKTNELNMSLEQMLYDGGKVSQAREIADIEMSLNVAEKKIIKRNIFLDIFKRFVQLNAIQKKLELQKNYIQNLKSQLIISAKEKDLGDITQLDFLEIQTKLEEAKLELFKLINQQEIETTSLKKLLRLSAQDELEFGTRLLTDTENFKLSRAMELISFPSLYSFAVKNQVEKRKIYLQYIKTFKELKTLEYSYIPVISLAGNYTLSGEGLPREKAYSFGLVFNFSFGGSSTKANYNANAFENRMGSQESSGINVGVLDNLSIWGSQYLQTKISLRELQEQEINWENDLELEIFSLYKSIDLYFESYEVGNKKYRIVEQRLKIASLQLNLGEIKRLDLVNLEFELLQSKFDLLNIIVQYISTIIELELKAGLPFGFFKIFNIKDI